MTTTEALLLALKHLLDFPGNTTLQQARRRVEAAQLILKEIE